MALPWGQVSKKSCLPRWGNLLVPDDQMVFLALGHTHVTYTFQGFNKQTICGEKGHLNDSLSHTSTVQP